jgi:hypothetical protein
MPNVTNKVLLLHEYCLYKRLIDSHKSKIVEGSIIHRNMQPGQRKPRTPCWRIPHLLQLLSSRFWVVGKIAGMSTLVFGTQQVRENKWYVGYNSKDNIVIRLQTEIPYVFIHSKKKQGVITRRTAGRLDGLSATGLGRFHEALSRSWPNIVHVFFYFLKSIICLNSLEISINFQTSYKFIENSEK